MTDGQRYVLLYTLGLDGRPMPHKNYFFAKPGDRFFDDCAALEAMGYLCRKSPGPRPPDVEFNATVDGVQVAMGIVQREAIEAWMKTGNWPKKRREVAR